MRERILIVDLGSQYTQLIARRIREVGVYCEVIHYNTPIDEIRKFQANGIILSGGPSSVYEKFSPKLDLGVFKLGVPMLGICYGMQLMIKHFGGEIEASKSGEYGKTETTISYDTTYHRPPTDLFSGIGRTQGETISVWMSHGDKVTKLPKGFTQIAKTDNTEYAAVQSSEGEYLGIQFHPEVHHTDHGSLMLKNFARKICHCKDGYKVSSFIEAEVDKIKAMVGPDDIVICGLSGGVDSAVAAAIVRKAIGDQQKCILVDHGLMREGEVDEIKKAFPDVTVVDDSEMFLSALEGITDPEEKRKIIGHEFIESFKCSSGEARLDSTDWELHASCERCHWGGHPKAEKPECICMKNGKCFLVQGTLYPDVIESESVFSDLTDVIKSHHNVGGLPEELGFELIEPLRMMFKDEVREVGRELGLSSEIVDRQPFPGPGLAIRILGGISKERIDAVRQADAIVRKEIDLNTHLGVSRPWQYFAALLPIRSVGVMGDKRTYEETIVVRAVSSVDGMTADFSRLDYGLLSQISNRIVNEVKGVNRVVYDITSKPPGTIEWE